MQKIHGVLGRLVISFFLCLTLASQTQGQEWAVGRPRGVLKVVDLWFNNASLMWALMYVTALYLVAYGMYRRKWFLKV